MLSDTGMGKYSDVPSQTPLVRPKSAIYTPKVDATSIPVTFIWEPPSPPPGLYLPFCLQAEAVVLIQNLSDGANSYPSVQNKDQDLKRTNISLTKVNKQINDKKEKNKNKRKKNTKEDFATPIATISPFKSGLKAFLLS